MGDVCTGTPTATSFSASTTLSTFVSQSTSQSISVGEGSVVTRTVSFGTTFSLDESTIAGATSTIEVEVPVTLTSTQVVQVPIATLFAPCSSSTTSTTSTTRATSTAPVVSETSSTAVDSTPGATSRRSATSSASQNGNNNNNSAANTQTAATPIQTPTSQASATPSETGTLITSVSTGITTLPNGSQSVFSTVLTTSVPPNGSLNGNDNTGGGGSGSNSKAVAIGVGVTGGVIALIILIFGITWHIRRKRRNSFDGLMDSDIWAPGREPKSPLDPRTQAHVRAGSGYTYNPYADASTRYAAVPTGSPPRSRPLSLADPLAATGYPPPGYLPPGYLPPAPQPGSLGVTAPLLTRAKTADEILYEAARQDLPRSRTSSAAASHQTRLSETGLIHRPNASLSASHRTHGSVTTSHMTHASDSTKSRRSESVGGVRSLDTGPRASVHQYEDIMEAPADLDRPMSPVSVVAPRLAIANPDADRD